jgi:hypothetical protein
MHFGTFQLTDEARGDPMFRIRKAMGARAFFVPDPGQSFQARRE